MKIIKYKASYKIGVTFFVLLEWLLVYLNIKKSYFNSERSYCITDAIIKLIGLSFVGAMLVGTFVLAMHYFYDCMIINEREITIRQFRRKTVTADPETIQRYRIDSYNSLEIFIDGIKYGMSLKEVNNPDILTEYLKEYCGKERTEAKTAKSDSKAHDRVNKEICEKEWILKVPSKPAVKYIIFSRLFLETVLLTYLFWFQFSRFYTVEITLWLMIVVNVWIIARIIFWQDAISAFWCGFFPKIEEKKQKWLYKFFMVTPILGGLLFFCRITNLLDEYHVYVLGKMNLAIIGTTVGMWLLMTIIKRVFYGKNSISKKYYLFKQVIILVVALFLCGQIVYGASILSAPWVERVEVSETRRSHTRGRHVKYYIDVRYIDGKEDRFRVHKDTYYKDEHYVRYYYTIFGSEYRYLENNGE